MRPVGNVGKIAKIEKRGKRWMAYDKDGHVRFATKDEIAKSQNKGKSMAKKKASTTRGTTVRVRGKHPIDYDEYQLAWIIRGWVEQARGQGDDLSAQRIFEPRDDDDEAAERERNRKFLELGRDLYDVMGKGINYFGISDSEWASWYSRLIKPSGRPSPSPLADRVKLAANAWLPPVVGPISSRFGEKRGQDYIHKGVDIAVPVGTPVVAPQTLYITKTDHDEVAGRFIKANVQRLDGTFEDDGYEVFFAHLSQIKVAEEQVIQRGDVVGYSGKTGRVYGRSGAHLHFGVKWIDDKVGFDDEFDIDPLGLISEQVFTGMVSPTEHPGGAVAAFDERKPINVIVAPGAGKISVGSHGITNPDTDVTVGPRVQKQSADPLSAILQPPPVQQISAMVGDPLAAVAGGAEQALGQIAQLATQAGTATAENLPLILQTIGGLAAAGGAVGTAVGTATLQPEVVAVAGPVAAGGLAVAGVGTAMQGGGGDPLAAVMPKQQPLTTV